MPSHPVTPATSGSTTAQPPPVAGVAPPPSPPAELGLWAAFAAPEADLVKLAQLAPSVAAEASGTVRGFRDTLGPGIGSEVDLSRPAFLATGSDPDGLIAFSVVAASSNNGLKLPPSLRLNPKAPGIDSLVLAEGQEHPWIGDHAACEVQRRVPPNGALVCAPKQGNLDVLGDYLARAAASARPTPPIYVEIQAPLFRKAFADSKESPLVELLATDSALSLAADFDSSGIGVDVGLSVNAGSPLARTLLALKASSAKPSEFRERPPGALFAVSLVAPASGREGAQSSALLPSGALLNPALALLAFAARGPIGFAYGVDLAAAKKRLEQWVAADTKSGGAAAPGQFQAVQGWCLYRVKGTWFNDLLRELEAEGQRNKKAPAAQQAAPPSQPPQELVRVSPADGLPRGTLHLLSHDDDDVPLHAFFVPLGNGGLIVTSADVDAARAAARQAVQAPPKDQYSDYFEGPGAVGAIATGFARPEVFAALEVGYESSYARERSLGTLQSLDKAPERKALAAPFRCGIEGADGSRARLLCSIQLPSGALNLWAKEIFEGLGRL